MGNILIEAEWHGSIDFGWAVSSSPAPTALVRFAIHHPAQNEETCSNMSAKKHWFGKTQREKERKRIENASRCTATSRIFCHYSSWLLPTPLPQLLRRRMEWHFLPLLFQMLSITDSNDTVHLTSGSLRAPFLSLPSTHCQSPKITGVSQSVQVFVFLFSVET